MNGDVGDRSFRPALEALDLLLEPGAVAELRAIGRDGRIASGYFDAPAKLATAAEVLDDATDFQGIYVTLNPVNPALLARRANRVETRLGRKDATTADADIVRRRWLPIDVDPVRPSGVSSTAEEHRAACGAVRAIREFLKGEGWPAPIVADSGNGGHLLYRIDLPTDSASTTIVKAVLAALDARFSTAAANVDTANFNAARIWKCYGTVSRKGDSTEDRPHRRSAIVAKPFEPEVVSVELLRALAASVPAPPEPPAPSAAGLVDLRTWLDDHGIAVASEKPWEGGTLYALARCPFSDAHRDGAYAIRFANGAVHAGCKHDSCGGGRQRWQELRARFEPAYAGRPGSPAVGEAVRPAHPAAQPAVMPAHPSPPPPGSRDGTALPSMSPSPEADPAVVATAMEVLEHDDPVRYFLDCFGEDHVGDTTLAHCLIMSIASQTVRNSRGLHVYVTGESGKGKSSGMTALLRQVPEEYRLAERMSNKALYYSDDINPGTVLLLDDIALSDELQEVLKETTSKFAEPVRMRTVDKDRRIRRYTIPERCVWWLANVSALYDEQVLNRMLTCWVDDSEEQDREVFRRKMAERARRPGDGGDRFDLLVCRELWRRLRADGLVHVDVPFAGRIRMASVRNRRNPEVLLDLIGSHALLFRFQRECERLEDGGLLVTATEDDFRYAARLFADLHTTGGSLEAKFDRNEEVVLSLAARNRVEQFTLHDLQRWTGWPYSKARRVLIGYRQRGNQYPGLLARSPALSVLDTTRTEDDDDGRDMKKRQLVFLFNPEIYRETRASGLAWLAGAEPENDHHDDRQTGDGQGDVYADVQSESVPVGLKPEKGADAEYSADDCPSTGIMKTDDTATGRSASGLRDLPHDGQSRPDTPGNGVERESERGETSFECTSGCPSPVHQPERWTAVDPRAFIAIDDPTFEPCSACGGKPSHYRELRGTRQLCKRCYGAAVRREQRAGPPLPNAIDPAALGRVAAEVGRCDVCGLEKAAWSGHGVHLCETCYQRESRRAVESGAEVVAPI
ncbi:MAG: hypothetical protein ABFC38_06450 [Methanospirillum sp.]